MSEQNTKSLKEMMENLPAGRLVQMPNAPEIAYHPALHETLLGRTVEKAIPRQDFFGQQEKHWQQAKVVAVFSGIEKLGDHSAPVIVLVLQLTDGTLLEVRDVSNVRVVEEEQSLGVGITLPGKTCGSMLAAQCLGEKVDAPADPAAQFTIPFTIAIGGQIVGGFSTGWVSSWGKESGPLKKSVRCGAMNNVGLPICSGTGQNATVISSGTSEVFAAKVVKVTETDCLLESSGAPCPIDQTDTEAKVFKPVELKATAPAFGLSVSPAITAANQADAAEKSLLALPANVDAIRNSFGLPAEMLTSPYDPMRAVEDAYAACQAAPFAPGTRVLVQVDDLATPISSLGIPVPIGKVSGTVRTIYQDGTKLDVETDEPVRIGERKGKRFLLDASKVEKV